MILRIAVLATLMSIEVADLTAFQTPSAGGKVSTSAAGKAAARNVATKDAAKPAVPGGEQGKPGPDVADDRNVPGKPVQNKNEGESTAQTTLSGIVRNVSGDPVGGATITLTAQDGKRQSAQSAANGAYSIPVPAAGIYDLVVQAPAALFGIRESMPLNGSAKRDFALRPASYFADPSWTQTLWCILFLLLYWLSMLMVTWHCIANSVQKLLCAHIREVETRLATEVDDRESPIIQNLKDKVEEIKRDAKPPRGISAVAEFLFWSRGRENAVWVALHEVERQIAARLAPPARVRVYLRSADADLRAVGKPTGIAVADAIRELLAADPSDPTNIESEKALLGRAISILAEDRDARFSTLMEWQNKASWLIFAAMLIIVFLTMASGHAIFFLAGAAGGFLSRLMRALRREDVPLDYGASWSTLFLSPAFGALAAWFGIAMITLAAHQDLNILGKAFQLIKWDDPAGPVTIAAAFLLGFSERWFDAVVGALEKTAESQEAAKANVIRAGAPPQQQAVPRTADTQQQNVPTPSAGGAVIKLPTGPISPVQVVQGKIVLDKPADKDVTVSLTSDKSNYPVRPQAVTITKGQTEASFEIVPASGAGAEDVKVTATITTLVISATVKFA